MTQNFGKGDRIKIKTNGSEVDQATIEEVKGAIISIICDKIPDKDKVIEFEYDNKNDCWYYSSGGTEGNALFRQFWPYSLYVA